MALRRRIVLAFFGVLLLAGIYGAVHNLPVLSGCYFYAECPQTETEPVEPPRRTPIRPPL